MSLYERMLGLSSQGFACAQIMMILTLEAENKQNPDLVRSIGALNNGFRDCGLVCGALTGGISMISYYAGQGEGDELPDPDYDAMAAELYRWFKEGIGQEYGGIECPVLLDGDAGNKLTRCPDIVERTFNRTIEILDEHELL